MLLQMLANTLLVGGSVLAAGAGALWVSEKLRKL